MLVAAALRRAPVCWTKCPRYRDWYLLCAQPAAGLKVRALIELNLCVLRLPSGWAVEAAGTCPRLVTGVSTWLCVHKLTLYTSARLVLLYLPCTKFIFELF